MHYAMGDSGILAREKQPTASDLAFDFNSLDTFESFTSLPPFCSSPFCKVDKCLFNT